MRRGRRRALKPIPKVMRKERLANGQPRRRPTDKGSSVNDPIRNSSVPGCQCSELSPSSSWYRGADIIDDGNRGSNRDWNNSSRQGGGGGNHGRCRCGLDVRVHDGGGRRGRCRSSRGR